jgi:hypothetical protein
MPENILIIDGHGTDLSTTFDFKRTGGTKVTLYSYTFSDISVSIDQSNARIATALGGNIPMGYSNLNTSRIGGTKIKDRCLSAMAKDEWEITFPAGFKKIQIMDRKVQLAFNGNAWGSSSVIYFRFTPGIDIKMNLSTILDAFDDREYSVLWMACR